MAKSINKNAKPEKKFEYLTTRALVRAVSKGTRHIADEVLERQGFLVMAKDGWVVRINRDGSEERISELPAKSNEPIDLD